MGDDGHVLVASSTSKLKSDGYHLPINSLMSAKTWELDTTAMRTFTTFKRTNPFIACI